MLGVSQGRPKQPLLYAADEVGERASRAFGATWTRAGRSLALRVPWLVVPHDGNVVLNALHRRMGEVAEVARERVSLGPRLRLSRLERMAGP